MENETITPQMIAKCQEIMKSGLYDGNKFEVEVGPFAACTVTQALFPEILDMALEHLKRKASHSLVEWIEQPISAEWKRKQRDEKLVPIPIFQSRKEQFS